MRALVPLVTAAALAIGGWLALGVVTIRSLDDPSRIGLLPPPRTLLVIFVSLVALAFVAPGGRLGQPPLPKPRRRWWPAPPESRLGRQSRRPAGHVVLLLTPVVLPWLPLPLPPALLAWTGPLAIGWWLACIAYVYADAFTGLAARARAVLVSPVLAPVAAALVTGVLLAATAWHTATQHPRGDEPDYLIVTQSLLRDGDLQIENNHAQADYAAYHRGVLPPSYLQRGRNGAIYSVHAPGLPVLLAPGFAVAGYAGAVVTLVLWAMAGAWLAWRTGWQVTEDVTAAWIGMLATVGAAPYFLHGAAIFPDAPASVLTLVATAGLLEATRGGSGGTRTSRWIGSAVALALLPWLHTRYALLAAGLGTASLVTLVNARAWRSLGWFLAIGAGAAVGWLGFFWHVYGVPDPSAPYGSYTQMAVAHLAPGVPGLLIDQQFGLLASAPALALAAVSLRTSGWRADRAVRVRLLVLGLSVIYLFTVAAYRMWWGGLSAPARFLVPIVLPLAPLVAVGWHSLRTAASRHLALVALAVSLALTTVLVVAEHGALAYNARDGQARWAAWASPLVDLSAGLPAAHRDAPWVVTRDAVVWLAFATLAWAAWRALERRGRFGVLVSMSTVAWLVPAASATVRAAHGVPGWAPIRSQVRFIESGADPAAGRVLLAITPPPVGRTRTWFEVDLGSRRPTAAGDFTLLRIPRLPAGTYRLRTDIDVAGRRLGLTLGEGRAERFLAEIGASAVDSVRVTLPLPVESLVVRGSAEAVRAPGRVWLEAERVLPSQGVRPATRTAPIAGTVWLLPEDDVYAEGQGAWIAGDADVTVGIVSDGLESLQVRAGAAPVTVTFDGAVTQGLELGPGEMREVRAPTAGRVRIRTQGGFRPSQATPGSDDQRWLGVWIAGQ